MWGRWPMWSMQPTWGRWSKATSDLNSLRTPTYSSRPVIMLIQDPSSSKMLRQARANNLTLNNGKTKEIIVVDRKNGAMLMLRSPPHRKYYQRSIDVTNSPRSHMDKWSVSVRTCKWHHKLVRTKFVCVESASHTQSEWRRYAGHLQVSHPRHASVPKLRNLQMHIGSLHMMLLHFIMGSTQRKDGKVA